MMQPPSPEDETGPETSRFPGQLSFDDLTRQLCEAIGGGEWFLLLDDDLDRRDTTPRRRRRG